MNYKYYITDVFTNKIFNGAQIAVFPDADGLDKKQMASVARELNLSETVFVFHQENVQTNRRLRIFTPFGEVDFAGHPIIGTAYVLATYGDIELTNQYTPVDFEQNVGTISVNITNAGGKPVLTQFSRTVSPIVDRFAPSETELASFLSIDVGQIDSKKYNARLVSCGVPYLIVPVYYYETVHNLKFNYEAWSRSVAPQTAAQEILVFAGKTPFLDSDFTARLVGPKIGVNEDPPIGSAMTAFASYLCSFDHMRKGTYTYAVDRGVEGIRRSVINLEMDHKKEEKLTIRVGGEAVIVAEGSMLIPDSV